MAAMAFSVNLTSTIRTSTWRVDDLSFRRRLAECAMIKLIPQRMAYLRFGPEGSKDRGGTA